VKTNPLQIVSLVRQRQEFVQAREALQQRLGDEARIGGLTAHVEVVVTQSGLRIELIEGDAGDTFFALGSARMQPACRDALVVIGQELAKLRNPVVIEGHTDAAPYAPDVTYTNWELSADRANAARRVLEAAGLDPDRLEEVKGLADRDLRDPQNPLSPINRRISILLPFLGGPADAGAPPLEGEPPPAPLVVPDPG
jgi:chemotaxis protein MotB